MKITRKHVDKALETTEYLMQEMYSIFKCKIERAFEDDWLIVSNFLKKELNLKNTQVAEFTDLFIKDFNNRYFKGGETT